MCPRWSCTSVLVLVIVLTVTETSGGGGGTGPSEVNAAPRGGLRLRRRSDGLSRTVVTAVDRSVVSEPSFVASLEGNLFIADTGHHCIKRVLLSAGEVSSGAVSRGVEVGTRP